MSGGGPAQRPLLRHLQPSSGAAPAEAAQPLSAARDLAAEYSSAFAVEAAGGGGAAGASAAAGLWQGAGSPGSPQGMFTHAGNASFSSSRGRRSSDSGAGPMAWQPSQHSLQGHGSVTAAIPDPTPHGRESGGSGSAGARGPLQDVPSPAETVSVAAGPCPTFGIHSWGDVTNTSIHACMCASHTNIGRVVKDAELTLTGLLSTCMLQ